MCDWIGVYFFFDIWVSIYIICRITLLLFSAITINYMQDVYPRLNVGRLGYDPLSRRRKKFSPKQSGVKNGLICP